jgi:phthalate 4,5-dioxygenase oxygenase subunit
MAAMDYVPDERDYTRLAGDRYNAWGQDRTLMETGHFTGFGRSLLEEDAVVQTSMGPIVDRSKETLSSGDVAVVHARRMLLDAVAAVQRGELPPGSVEAPEGVRMPNAVEVVVPEGQRWEDSALDQVTG